MAGGYLFIALTLLTLVDTDAAPRVNAGEAVGTFLYKITNNARSPTFDVNATLPVVGGPLIRYMEQTVLRDPTQFKSFVVNFTNPYGDFVVSMNGVKDTYYQDGYYWEFFVNTKAIDVGVSFYEPNANDVVQLLFTKDSACKYREPQRNFCAVY